MYGFYGDCCYILRSYHHSRCSIRVQYIHGVAPATVFCRRRRQQHRQEVSRHGQGGGRRCHVTFPAYTWQHRALAHNTTGSAIQCHGRRTAQLRLPILSLVPVDLEGDISVSNAQENMGICQLFPLISGNIHKIIIYLD